MWDEVDVVLKDAKAILDELQAYKGAGQEIREVHLTEIRTSQLTSSQSAGRVREESVQKRSAVLQ